MSADVYAERRVAALGSAEEPRSAWRSRRAVRAPLDIAPPITSISALCWIAVGDGFRSIGMQGPVTILSVGLLIVGCIVTLPLAVRRSVSGFGAGLLSVGLVALVWVSLVACLVGRNADGIQNIAVYAAAGAAFWSAYLGEDGLWLLAFLRLAPFAALLIAVIWLPTIVTSGLGKDGLVDTRGAVSLGCVIGMVACISQRGIRGQILQLTLMAVVLLTLSRTAIFCGALVLVLTPLASERARYLKAAAALIAVLVAGTIIWFSFPALQARFEDNDNVQVGGVVVGTSGRSSLWSALLGTVSDSNVLAGQGAGAASRIITDDFLRITQPHDEYLRFLIDYGAIGFVLLAALLLTALVASATRVIRGDASLRLQVVGLCSIVVVIVYCAVDNLLVYVFAMVPLAAMVGIAVRERPLMNAKTRTSVS